MTSLPFILLLTTVLLFTTYRAHRRYGRQPAAEDERVE